MTVQFGKGKTAFGPGIDIILSGDEVAIAIDNYLKLYKIDINGPRTIRINGELCEKGEIYIDPSGEVTLQGRGTKDF